MVFFLLAAIWFVALAVAGASGVGERLTNGYHTVMMTAMVWMFAVIHSGPSAGSDHPHHHDVHASGMHTSSGIDASSMELSPNPNEPAWIAAINWIATLGFAIAAVYWRYRVFVERRTSPVSHDALLARTGPLGQACMAAGMAIMFGATV